jgi:aminopeptidase N
LLYLSTLSYLDPAARPPGAREGVEGLFFSEILQAHETAHQWWGNTVATADYQDDWLMEALSNYSALLYLEKRKGAKAMESVLEEYKARLLSKDQDGNTLESAGPITWSLRLHSSQTPKSWRTITYEKGSWIIHMLRRRMGDERFSAMLAEMCKRYRFRTTSTEEFRALAAEFMPKDVPDRTLEAFFEQWVYGTGIPVLKMGYSIKGKAPALTLTGTLKQSDVPDDYSALVPVEIQYGRGKSVTEWVRTGPEAVVFTVKLKQMPLKVVLDPGGAVLAKK